MMVGLLGQQGEVTGFLNLAVKGEVIMRGPGGMDFPLADGGDTSVLLECH